MPRFSGTSFKPTIGLRTLGSHITMYHRRMDRAVDRASERALVRQASYCTAVARRMLVKAKPGENRSSVPRLHSGNYFKLSVNWGYDRFGRYSVSGPIQISRRNVPRALEHGGTSVWVRNHFGRRLRGRQRVKAKPFMKKAQALTIHHFPGQFRGTFRP